MTENYLSLVIANKWPFGECFIYVGNISQVPSYFIWTLILESFFISYKFKAFKLVDNTSIDFVHSNFPIDILTTGSSGPIFIATVPSSNPNPIML